MENEEQLEQEQEKEVKQELDIEKIVKQTINDVLFNKEESEKAKQELLKEIETLKNETQELKRKLSESEKQNEFIEFNGQDKPKTKKTNWFEF